MVGVITPFWKALCVVERPDGSIIIPDNLKAEIAAYRAQRPSLSLVQALAGFAHTKATMQPKPGEITPAQLNALGKAFDAERRANPMLMDTEIVERIRKRGTKNPLGVGSLL